MRYDDLEGTKSLLDKTASLRVRRLLRFIVARFVALKKTGIAIPKFQSLNRTV